jgi:hypothetical protein
MHASCSRRPAKPGFVITVDMLDDQSKLTDDFGADFIPGDVVVKVRQPTALWQWRIVVQGEFFQRTS